MWTAGCSEIKPDEAIYRYSPGVTVLKESDAFRTLLSRRFHHCVAILERNLSTRPSRSKCLPAYGTLTVASRLEVASFNIGRS